MVRHYRPTHDGTFALLKNERAVADVFPGSCLTHGTCCLLIESPPPHVALQFAQMANGDDSSSASSDVAAADSATHITAFAPAVSQPQASRMYINENANMKGFSRHTEYRQKE